MFSESSNDFFLNQEQKNEWLCLMMASLGWHGVSMTLEEWKNLLSMFYSNPLPIDKMDQLLSPQLQKKLSKTPKWWRESERQIRWCYEHSLRLTYPGHIHYPQKILNTVNKPPLMMVYRGEPTWNHLGRCFLSVVGSREPSLGALNWMDQNLYPLLEEFDIVTLSGAARGIDQKIHSLSLRVKKPTIAFIPTGFKSIYPKNFQPWVEKIIDNEGAVVSFFPPLSSIQKKNFHIRNYYIAALSAYILIVQSKKNSGSLLTANMGLKLNIDIGVTPASPWSIHNGNNALLRDGAQYVSDIEDLKLWLGLKMTVS